MKKTLKRLFKGGSSKKLVVIPIPKPRIELEVDEDHPYGYNEFFNYAARHNIPLPDDQLPPDSSPNRRCLAHPIYSGYRFEWQDILNGTQNRTRANMLARGDFGQLYRCDISESDSVAVKFQDPVNPSAHEEFMAETTILQRADHQNVIKLVGKSFGRNELALIYEYMPGGSLDQHLLKHVRRGPGLPENYPVLNWEMRTDIAVGVALALNYLHTELKVIHRDVEIGNVLLDEEFKPKLTNFRWAVEIVLGEDGNEVEWVINPSKGTPGCLAPEDSNEVEWEINPSKGTPGCLAPETEESSLVSTKTDVYSYGVFLFQLFTGMKAYDFGKPLAARNLTDWMKLFWSGEEYVPAVMDAALRKRYSVQGLSSLYEVARKCTDPQANARPSMEEIVGMVSDAASQDVTEFPDAERDGFSF